MNLQIKSYLIVFLMILFCVGCEFEKSTYTTLSSMGTAYDSIMTISGNLYKEGKLSEEQKTKIIDSGLIFYAGYQTTVTAFESYKINKNENLKQTIINSLVDVVKNYNVFIGYYNTAVEGINGVKKWEEITEIK